MTFEIAVGDRVRAVSVTPQGAAAARRARRPHDDGRCPPGRRDGAVAAGGARRTAPRQRRASTLSLAAQRTAGDFDVHVAGRTIPVQVRQAGGFGRQKKAGAAAGHRPAAHRRAHARQDRARAGEGRRRGEGAAGPGRGRGHEDGERAARRPRRPRARRRRWSKGSRSTPAPSCWSWSSGRMTQTPQITEQAAFGIRIRLPPRAPLRPRHRRDRRGAPRLDADHRPWARAAGRAPRRRAATGSSAR